MEVFCGVKAENGALTRFGDQTATHRPEQELPQSVGNEASYASGFHLKIHAVVKSKAGR